MRGHFLHRFILLAFFFLQTLHAQNHSLNDALALTLLNNPQLNSYSYEMRAADARTLQASLYPNPGFDVETENIGAPRFSQTTFMLSQLIELGGKRKARLHFAQRERDRVALDYEVMKRQLYVDTTLLFIEALIQQQKLTFLEETLKTLQEFSPIVEKRIKAGKASIIEESNFIVMINTAHIDLVNAKNELRKAKSKLAAQWGEPNNDTFIILGTLDWIPELISLEEMGNLLEDHPEVLRTHVEDNLRRAKVALERSLAIPDVNVRGGPRYLKEAKKWVWCVGLFVPLPINDRNQGRILESRENLSKLEREREALWVKLLTELNSAYSTIQTAIVELNLLKNAILPAAQKAYEFSYKGYERARYNYLELIETERAYRTSKVRYLQALGEYHKAFTVLQGLTGTTLHKCPDDIFISVDRGSNESR